MHGQIPGGYSGLPGNSDEHVLLQSQPPGRYYARVFNRSGTVSAQEYRFARGVLDRPWWCVRMQWQQLRNT